MTAANTDKLRKLKSRFSTTLNGGINNSVDTIALSSTSGLPTDTAVTLSIDRVDSNGDSTPSLHEVVTGVISGSNLTNAVRGEDGTSAAAHSSGAVVEYIWNGDIYNDMVDWGLAQHTQAGIHEFADAEYLADTSGNELIKFDVTASAVNEIQIANAATGNFPTISASGEADTGIDFENSEGEEILKLDSIASSVNEVTIASAATNNPPTISATGGDTDVSLKLIGKGAGTVKRPTSVVIQVVDGGTSTTTGDGKAYFVIPPELNGMVISAVFAAVVTAGTTNTTDIQIRNVTDTVDVLSTKLTIDSAETTSATAATPAVINTSNDDVATNDVFAIDVDAVSTTAAKGLVVRITFGF